jgi:hypothetical protein
MSQGVCIPVHSLTFKKLPMEKEKPKKEDKAQAGIRILDEGIDLKDLIESGTWNRCMKTVKYNRDRKYRGPDD